MNQRNNPNQTDRRLLTVSDRDIFVTVQNALLVGIILANETRADKEESLKELTSLVKTAGSDPSIIQTKRVDRINPKTFIGKGSIIELIGFLDFCAFGTAPAETLKNLERDGIVFSSGGEVTLTQDGNDLKSELRLAGGGYLSNQSKTPSVGNELDDLLSKLG